MRATSKRAAIEKCGRTGYAARRQTRGAARSPLASLRWVHCQAAAAARMPQPVARRQSSYRRLHRASGRRRARGALYAACMLPLPARADMPPCGRTRRRPSLLPRGMPCADDGRRGSFFGARDHGQARRCVGGCCCCDDRAGDLYGEGCLRRVDIVGAVAAASVR